MDPGKNAERLLSSFYENTLSENLGQCYAQPPAKPLFCYRTAFEVDFHQLAKAAVIQYDRFIQEANPHCSGLPRLGFCEGEHHYRQHQSRVRHLPALEDR